MENLAPRMEQGLPQHLLAFLRLAGEVAQAEGQSLYLVGGAVRDLLLSRPNLDFDLVVEGDAPRLARQLARASGEKVVTHPRFGTAKFSRSDLSIDLVTARSESYPRPGALPEVKPGTIWDDLSRRDFSINAMAIHLAPASYGQLFDPHRGKTDLVQRLIRILHPKSFIDDATRILRALRYEQRLGFDLEENTEKLLRQYKSMLDTISGDRIRHEVELILEEKKAEQILNRAEELGVLQELHPSLRGNGWLAQKFHQARQLAPLPPPSLYLSLLLYHLAEAELESVIARLNIAGEMARDLRQMVRLKADLPALADPNLPRSGTYRRLRQYSPQAITACALACDSLAIRGRLQLYLDDLRYVKLFIDGEDLKKMGVAPGPRLGKMLKALLEAKLDNKVSTKEEEEALVRQWLAGKGI
jgi:tRNA nucleotidyltransferase (CCA-adding enzyme)